MRVMLVDIPKCTVFIHEHLGFSFDKYESGWQVWFGFLVILYSNYKED